MKKSSLLLFFGIYLTVQSQNTESISLSYSVAPTTFTLKPTLFWYSDDKKDPFQSGFRMIASWDDITPNPIKYLLGATGIKKIETQNISQVDWRGLEEISYNSYNLSYKHRFKKNIALGATFIYGSFSYSNKDSNLSFDQCNSNIMSLALEFTKIYGKNVKPYYLYNSFVLYPLILENTEFKKDAQLIAQHSLSLYAYELRLLGIKGRLSRQSNYCYEQEQAGEFSYFADIGFGYMGLLRVGLAYDF